MHWGAFLEAAHADGEQEVVTATLAEAFAAFTVAHSDKGKP